MHCILLLHFQIKLAKVQSTGLKLRAVMRSPVRNNYCMFDFLLMILLKLPFVDRIQTQSNKFTTGVEKKAAGDSKRYDSSSLYATVTVIS